MHGIDYRILTTTIDDVADQLENYTKVREKGKEASGGEKKRPAIRTLFRIAKHSVAVHTLRYTKEAAWLSLN